MGRKSSKQARIDRLSQKGQRRDAYKRSAKPKDGKDWTDNILKKIKEAE